MLTRNNNPIAVAARAAIETLEDRRLMSASVIGDFLSIDGTENNDVIDVSLANGKFTVIDNGVTKQFPLGTIDLIIVNGRGGNDILRLAANINIDAIMAGGEGNDTIRGGSGKDSIHGEAGDDIIDGGLGADEIEGGDGIDTIDYSTRTTPITVSLLNTVNQGALFEGDILRQFENVNGGSANDTLIGNAGVNVLNGRGGNDSIRGGGGNDTLYGEAGNDALFGEDHNDYLYGGLGNDMLYGGNGNDVMFGDAGNDSLDGGLGADDFNGGTDMDSALYISRVENLTITLGSTADDGAVGEKDNVRTDVENVIGGKGNDRITGSSAANRLFGGEGNDWISGLGGDDVIGGDAGDDRLFGGTGKDVLNGNLGNDVLVTLDSVSDTANGGDGVDSFWVNSSDVTDATSTEKSSDRFHVLSTFANGASIDPAGQNISDPSIAGLEDVARVGTMSFSNNPLFLPGGPKFNDIDQNALGDCYFLSGLSGVAKTKPQLITESVVELGDGTFAVRFFSGGTVKYYRVDGQLALHKTFNIPAFAGIGGGLWVAIMEKAYAHHAGSNTYDGIVSGWGDEAFEALGKKTDYWFTVLHSESAMVAKIKDVLAKGGSVTAGTDPTDVDTDYVSGHSYTILSISGTTLTLRNPWGTDGRGGDSTNDGIITMSMTKFDDNFTTLLWSYL